MYIVPKVNGDIHNPVNNVEFELLDYTSNYN